MADEWDGLSKAARDQKEILDALTEAEVPPPPDTPFPPPPEQPTAADAGATSDRTDGPASAPADTLAGGEGLKVEELLALILQELQDLPANIKSELESG